MHLLRVNRIVKPYYHQMVLQSQRLQHHEWQHLMLTPFDAVKSDAFLYQLPQRTQVPQESYPLLHRLQDIVDLALCCETTDAETNTAVGALITAAESAQDVTRLKRGGCASTSRRQGDVLEGHQKGLALDVGKRYVDATRVEVVWVTILGGMLHRKKALE